RRVVGPDAFHLLRAVGWRHLMQLARQVPHAFEDIFHAWQGCLTHHAALQVVRVRLSSESDGAAVHLGLACEPRREARRTAHEQHEKTNCKRIERTMMTDPALTQYAARECNDVMRRHPCRLV